MEEIKVIVVKYADRENYLMRYDDPMTGKRKTKSAGTSNKKEAEKAAGKWEAELREGRYVAPKKITWDSFRERYEDEVLKALAPKTQRKVDAVFNVLEAIVSPKKLSDLTSARVSYWQTMMRKADKSENTIKSSMAHLKAALRWAHRMGMLAKVPTFEMPKRAKSGKVMKGRAITGEEFDRMLDKVSSVVGEAATESWKFYLQGLWHSGLRLGESLVLSWDADAAFRVDLTGPRPMLMIPAESEKGNEDRILPVAPDFARLLESVPQDDRQGFVFRPLTRVAKRYDRLGELQVSRVVGAIGKAAGVIVNHAPKKFASAHDLRRSFGQRWSAKVMPQVLMVLMRHENIETTMRFYVGRDAEATAEVLWATEGNTEGNIDQNEQKNKIPASGASADSDRD